MNFWYEGWMVTCDCMLFSAGCKKKQTLLQASYLFIIPVWPDTNIIMFSDVFLNKLFIGLRKKLCLDVRSMEKSLYIAMVLPAVFGCRKHPHCLSIYIESRSHLKLPNFTQPRRLKQNIFLQKRNVHFSIFLCTSGWKWLLELNSDSQNGFWRRPKKN